MQLRNQIVLGIACAEFTDGQSLPSVRQLAQVLGVNMHTVNKAYSILREEGYLKLDRRKGRCHQRGDRGEAERAGQHSSAAAASDRSGNLQREFQKMRCAI